MYEPNLQEFLSPETYGGDGDQHAGKAADPAQDEQHLQDQFHVSEECKQPRNIQELPQQFQGKSYRTNCRPQSEQFNQEAFASKTEEFSIPSTRHYAAANCYSRCQQYQPIPGFNCRRGIEEFGSCAQPVGVRLSSG